MATTYKNDTDIDLLQKTDEKPASKIQIPPHQGSRAAVLLALLAIYIIWGSTYLGIRIALEGFPPFMMAGVRFVIAGAMLFVFMLARGAKVPTRKQWLGASVVGLLLLVGGNGGVTFAEKWISSGLAALAVGTMPLWAALFAGLWGRWPTRFEWGGLALGFVGVALLNLEGDFRANPLAAIVLFAAPVCWALGSVLSNRLTLPPGLMASASEMLVGGVALCLLSLAFGEKLAGPPSVRAMLAVGYLIVFGSLIAFSAYLYLLGRVRPALATSYAYVNPAVAVALGVGLAGEQIAGPGVLAMLAILTAVVLISFGRGSK